MARSNAGLSKRQLALRARLTPGYITYIEAGQKTPSLDAVERIARALSIPVPLLFLMSAEEHELEGIDAQQGAAIAEHLQAILHRDDVEA